MPGAKSTTDTERLQREKAFHNDVFKRDDRGSVAAYSVIDTSSREYKSLILPRAQGKSVLEYGCGPGTYSFQLAPVAGHVTGIDLSEVAIEKARRRSVERNAPNTEFHVMDAENLTFPDATFDLVCGRAILHHLNLARAFQTIGRVLKPGGIAIFHEPLGHNPMVNLYRRFTPSKRTVDEHPLLDRDIDLARQYFDRVEVKPFVLFSLFAAPLHKVPGYRLLVGALEAVDRAVFRIPGAYRYGWTSIWIMQYPKRPR